VKTERDGSALAVIMNPSKKRSYFFKAILDDLAKNLE
jgi:hypothetical protein